MKSLKGIGSLYLVEVPQKITTVSYSIEIYKEKSLNIELEDQLVRHGVLIVAGEELDYVAFHHHFASTLPDSPLRSTLSPPAATRS